VEERSREVWASFPHDPRDPAVAGLRASDADRNVIHNVLTEGFADGRLDREEYDERTAALMQARTLGQLPPLVIDLVPDQPLLPAKLPLSTATGADIQRRAEEKWHRDRREALLGFLGPTVITWAIWVAINLDGGISFRDDFPWPLIVMAVTFLNFVRVLASKSEIVSSEVRRLERKRAKEIEAQNKKQLDQ
jgi:hypothetical protein